MDALKPDTSSIGNVAPAAFALAPATLAVILPTAVAPPSTTPAAPAAMLQIPCKALTPVCSPQQTQMPSTGASQSQTSTTPIVLHQSTQSRKPPYMLLEEI